MILYFGYFNVLEDITSSDVFNVVDQDEILLDTSIYYDVVLGGTSSGVKCLGFVIGAVDINIDLI